MRTSYITTDLDLESDVDLQALTEHIPTDILVHYCGFSVGLYRVTLGLAGVDTTEEDAIETYCRYAESLDQASRVVWNSCSRIGFNFGYEAGDNPQTFHSTISVKSLARIASLGGEINITIYGRGGRCEA